MRSIISKYFQNTKIWIFVSALFVAGAILLNLSTSVSADEEAEDPKTYEAIITKVKEEKEIKVDGEKQDYQKLECKITDGSKKGDTVTVENGGSGSVSVRLYKKGDRVMLTSIKDQDGENVYYVTDYIRRDGLLILFVIFVGLSLLIAKKNGLFSLIAMALSFLVIMVFILPQIVAGRDPVIIVIIASIFLIPVTFYLSHGFNKETTVAIAGTIIALIMTGILSHLSVGLAHLTGFSSEEAMFLQGLNDNSYDLKGIFLAGMIISVLGVLDDITVAQTSVVYRLFETDSEMGFKQLYSRSIAVGKNHIASMINTLVLVYAGASLPLLMLFINNSRQFKDLINYEIVASEIVRMLVGSIGLILAVPITTFIASYLVLRGTMVSSSKK